MKIYFLVFQYIWYIRIYIENILKIEGNIHDEKINCKHIFIIFLESLHIALSIKMCIYSQKIVFI